MKLRLKYAIRLATFVLINFVASCAHETPGEGQHFGSSIGSADGTPRISAASSSETQSATSPTVDNLYSTKLLIGYSYVRGNAFPDNLIQNWSIRLKMSTSKSDFLSFDRGGVSFLLNAKRGERQEQSVFRYTVTDTLPIPIFGTPTLHTRCGVKPWVIYNTFALISSLDKKTILWAAHPSPSGEKIVIVEPHNFHRFKCSKATFPA